MSLSVYYKILYCHVIGHEKLNAPNKVWLKKLECEISIWVIHDVYTGIWYRIH